MYARSTTVRGNPQSLDQAIAYLRDEVMPAVQEVDGYVGLSMMCDRDSGRCIATTAWETEEAMHNSEGGVHDMRQRFATMLGGTPEVQEWEIGALHRKHEAPEGACCRVTWSRTRPEDAEQAAHAFRMTMLSRMDDLPGFCSVSVMVRPDEGLAVAAVSYDSPADLEQANEGAREFREEFAAALGIEVTDTAAFDVAIAHLRVPETA